MSRKAKVYLVGAGPGDPQLITCKGLHLLQLADVVIYDRLVSAEILALANPAATFVFAGKAQGVQEAVQQEIYQWFLHFGDRTGIVVRLKGGDPMVFGRGAEEIAFLQQNGFAVELVPGVSSAFAAPALAGIPLTYRGVAASFAVVAGHRESQQELDWSAYRGIDTLIVLMGVSGRDAIARELLIQGRPAELPVAFIERASTDRERVIVSTLGQVARGATTVESPAVWIIGEVVSHRSSQLATTVSLDRVAA